jgi:phosphoribosylformylglycinamidine synthase
MSGALTKTTERHENEGNMSWHAKVYVTLKPSVLDPQGATVQRALSQMGYPSVQSVRMGKFTELVLDGALPEAEAKNQVDEISDKLLANPNIESYRFTLEKK